LIRFDVIDQTVGPFHHFSNVFGLRLQGPYDQIREILKFVEIVSSNGRRFFGHTAESFEQCRNEWSEDVQ
jgi:hypothetical protein